jgi:hypothetical protein
VKMDTLKKTSADNTVMMEASAILTPP